MGSSGNIGIEPEVKATIQRFEARRERADDVCLRRSQYLWSCHPSRHRRALGCRAGARRLGRPRAARLSGALQQGGFYGWPYAYIGQNPQPGFADKAPEKVKASKRPDLLFEAHSSAMDIVFYSATQFPPEYRGDAFVVLKGSWNRAQPTGYKVVRVPFKNGRPQGHYENFVTGFWVSGQKRAEVWGRPAAIAVAKDGSLLIADDTAGTIWRVTYTGPPRKAALR